MGDFTPLFSLTDNFKQVRIANSVYKNLDKYWNERQLVELAESTQPDFSVVKTRLSPYQEDKDTREVTMKFKLPGF